MFARALRPLSPLVLAAAHVAPRHQRGGERSLLAAGAVDRRARALDAPAHLVGRPPDGVELVGVAGDQPLHPRPDRGAAEHDRHAWALYRLRPERRLLQPIMPALERASVLREQPVDDRELFLEPFEPLRDRREREPVGAVFLRPPARTHAELDTPPADVIDGRRGLRQHRRSAERHG
jgi:hypothetical protein